MDGITRRQFAVLAGAGVVAPVLRFPQVSKATLTAGEVVARIKQRIGIPWNDKTYRDTFKTGGPDTRVTGIASTFMSTFDVLKRAHAAGRNLIVTHEPTFWSDADTVTELQNDPMYRIKLQYANEHDIAIWRFHDHWHAMKPDGILLGWNKALGWDKYQAADNQRVYNIPETTLGEVATHIARALNSRSVRAIGDPSLKIRTVGRGAHTLNGNMAVLPLVDMVLISEAREWDSIEYIRDSIAAGQKKGMVLVSHEAGEEAGMDECARWLKTFVSEVPVEFIPTRDLLWIPS